LGKSREKSKMGRFFIQPTQKYGTPGELLKWSKKPEFIKIEKHLLIIRILMLDGKEAKIYNVAKTFGVSVKTVNRVVKRWNSGGKEALAHKPRSGRPRKFTEVHKKRVNELVNGQTEMNQRLTMKGVHGFLKG
jgi:transposase